MSQGDSYGSKISFGEKKWDRGGREAAGDGATSRSVEAYQFGDTGNLNCSHLHSLIIHYFRK